MNHTDAAANLPYRDATEACPECLSKNIFRCRCLIGEHGCFDCKYQWRTTTDEQVKQLRGK